MFVLRAVIVVMANNGKADQVVTYDDLTRSPDLCFLGMRSVGVTARDPTVELASGGPSP